MIELDRGITLPLPKKAKGFARPEGVSDWKWRQLKPEVWKRAYQHCLYSLHLHFELPLHSVVPRISKKMLEASDPFNVALRFIGEMQNAGYLKLDKGFDQRLVMPTKKLLDLNLGEMEAPDTSVKMPKLCNEDIPRAPIRGGVSSAANRQVVKVTSDMAHEKFEVNEYIYKLLQQFPPTFDEVGSEYMFNRAMTSANKMLGEVFRFPYFLCSRSRMYTDTTCGFSPQGADHEKALVIPTYKESLTREGFDALLETANGYSEQEWTVQEMACHATDPTLYEEVWRTADKPYSYMACANLIRRYLINPSEPLPAFIPLDGRCSGLQHWSAVVRSNAITRHLGMHKDEADRDIYEKVSDDWRATLPPEHHIYATRKAAKIPVMTWGYNATMMTSMEHMDKLFGAKKVWCKDTAAYVITGEGLERAMTGSMGADLYRRLNETLGPLRGAVDWVSNCATSIACYGNVEIHWLTPDGFEAMQRKVKGERRQIMAHLSNGEELYLEILDFTKDIPNTAKHRSAIAPNIIHGMDATHLRMVARVLKDLGLPMVFIHDSFSTHCNYRSTLYKIILDTFIELYSRNYLKDLYDFWTERYGVELTLPPEMGDWKPESIRELDSFFA